MMYMYVRMHDALRSPESIPIGVSCTFSDCVLPASCLLTGEMDGDVDVFSEAEYVYVCLSVCLYVSRVEHPFFLFSWLKCRFGFLVCVEEGLVGC